MESSGLKPFWVGTIIKCLRIKTSSSLNSNFSKILAKQDSNEIGQYLVGLRLEPDLYAGTTFASFKTSGKISKVIEYLINTESSSEITRAASLTKTRGI